eukprot:TRINITY_DN2412_c3_g1_i1.p1 TRINITY_DN2412_c3_g1~~TRINITY_DN2412_c3_g1_i1.p1  ORF type:complete len:500 (+),score=138.09 TRINITY_DN2412_c3_g1_i1:102-1601(+)
MQHAHMELVWATAKVQLYLLDARQVKKAIGREKIRRNKDALRELRCLQEILSDVYAGDFGRAPEQRRAAEAAASAWELLAAEAQRRNMEPEALCEVPKRIRPLLLSRPMASSGSPKGGAGSGGIPGAVSVHGASSSSTRAPSTAAMGCGAGAGTASCSGLGAGGLCTEAEETVSLAATTEAGRSEATSFLLAQGGPAEGSLIDAACVDRNHRSCQQLARLADDLREMIDQEYTSLVASIEEVQALMEAEVAGEVQKPSIEELEAFRARVELALEQSRGQQQLSEADTRQQQDVELLEPRKPVDKSAVTPATAAASGSCYQRPRWADLGSESDAPEEEDEDEEEEDDEEELQEPACGGREADADIARSKLGSNSLAVSSRAAPRPRWADLRSDSEEAEGEEDEEEEEEAAEKDLPPPALEVLIGAPGAPAKAQCFRCHRFLSRTSFSRRAWRQVRGLGSDGQRQPDSAACHDCSSRATAATPDRRSSGQQPRPARPDLRS